MTINVSFDTVYTILFFSSILLDQNPDKLPTSGSGSSIIIKIYRDLCVYSSLVVPGGFQCQLWSLIKPEIFLLVYSIGSLPYIHGLCSTAASVVQQVHLSKQLFNNPEYTEEYQHPCKKLPYHPPPPEILPVLLKA